MDGIFFMGSGRKQNWDDKCDFATMGRGAFKCNAPNFNFWDGTPGGLDTIRRAPWWPFFMCANMCGECEFTDSVDNMIATMHWFFTDAKSQTCEAAPEEATGHCRHGEAH